MIRRRLLAAGAIVLAAVGAGAVFSACFFVPPSIPSDCSVPDSGPTLGAWLNSLPANSTVSLPTNGCFNIAHSLDIHNTSGLTILGNGATLSQTVPGGVNAPIQGILYLRQNTKLAIEGLKVNGAYNGTNGGSRYEGNYGLFMEANHGIGIDNMTMSNIQGDFMILDPPRNGDTGTDTSLNTNVTIQNSTFTNAGYHGLTVESVNGLTVNNNTFTNMGVDAIDMEYEDYSTAFVNGQPIQAAEDNIHITNNTWSNFQDDWFASIQGQLPGVQEQNVSLLGNSIDAHSPLVEIVGTNPYLTPSQYWNTNLTVAFNRGLQGAIPTRGGSITDQFAGSGMSIEAVVGVKIDGNIIPLFDGTPDYFPNTPYMAVLQALEIQNLTMQGNYFHGALGILHPSSVANTNVKECNNYYGVNAAQTDGRC
jgi:hypothetical protein